MHYMETQVVSCDRIKPGKNRRNIGVRSIKIFITVFSQNMHPSKPNSRLVRGGIQEKRFLDHSVLVILDPSFTFSELILLLYCVCGRSDILFISVGNSRENKTFFAILFVFCKMNCCICQREERDFVHLCGKQFRELETFIISFQLGHNSGLTEQEEKDYRN